MRLLLGFVFCASLTAGAESKLVPFRLYTEFQHDPPGNIVSALHSELDSLMAPIGWEITWTPLRDANKVASVSLAIVRFKGSCDASGAIERLMSVRPLGESYLDNGEILPFLTIHCDVIRSFLYSSLKLSKRRDLGFLYGRAVARVVAHELFHVLTGEKRHADGGLLQEQLTPDELLSGALRFQPEQVQRLRVKLVPILIDSNPTVIDRDEKPGHRTYVLSGCSGCHGSSAQGTVWGPALRGPYDSETLQRWLTNRSSEMYRRAKTLRLLWPFLNGHDIEVLVEYLSTREQPSARPTLVAR